MDNPASININGYDTYFVETRDEIGKYLLIAIPPNADHDFSDICGKLIAGHLITQVDYGKTNDKVTCIKAYY